MNQTPQHLKRCAWVARACMHACACAYVYVRVCGVIELCMLMGVLIITYMLSWLPQVVSTFGNEVMAADGTIDRKILGSKGACSVTPGENVPTITSQQTTQLCNAHQFTVALTSISLQYLETLQRWKSLRTLYGQKLQEKLNKYVMWHILPPTSPPLPFFPSSSSTFLLFPSPSLPLSRLLLNRNWISFVLTVLKLLF